MTSTSNRCGFRTSSSARRSISISSKATAGWLAATVSAVSRNKPSVLRITVALCAAVTRPRPFAAAYRKAKSNTRSAALHESGLSEMPLSGATVLPRRAGQQRGERAERDATVGVDSLAAAGEPRAELARGLAVDVELDATVEPLGRLADDDDVDARRGRWHASTGSRTPQLGIEVEFAAKADVGGPVRRSDRRLHRPLQRDAGIADGCDHLVWHRVTKTLMRRRAQQLRQPLDVRAAGVDHRPRRRDHLWSDAVAWDDDNPSRRCRRQRRSVGWHRRSLLSGRAPRIKRSPAAGGIGVRKRWWYGPCCKRSIRTDRPACRGT